MKNIFGRVEKLEALRPPEDTTGVVVVYDPNDLAEPERAIAAAHGRARVVIPDNGRNDRG